MLSRAAIALLLLISGQASAMAQTADKPVMGSAAAEPAATGEETPERQQILVVGDAVGGGLGAGLLRMSEIDGRYDVTIRFNEESGLARPEVYDWGGTVPKILEGKDYDVIVVMLGTNDRQQIRSGNSRFAFDTPEWVDAYRAQLDRLMGALAASGAKVIWVGLPPMASSEYDAAMQTITALQRERAAANGVAFLDIRSYFLAPDGSYSDTGPDDTGTVRKLRGRDGITFFRQGNNRLGQVVLEAIVSGVAASATVQASAGGKTSIKASAPAVEVPFFGQADAAGVAVITQPRDVMSVATVALGDTPMPPSAALSALQALARPGSEAARLFATGEAGAAPKGRVDDFTAPPAAP